MNFFNLGITSFLKKEGQCFLKNLEESNWEIHLLEESGAAPVWAGPNSLREKTVTW